MCTVPGSSCVSHYMITGSMQSICVHLMNVETDSERLSITYPKPCNGEVVGLACGSAGRSLKHSWVVLLVQVETELYLSDLSGSPSRVSCLHAFLDMTIVSFCLFACRSFIHM